MAKVVAGDGTRNFVNIGRGRESTDSEDASSSKTLPVELLGRKKVSKVGPKIVEKFNSVWGDENTIVQNDNGSGQNVLVGIVALRKPAL